MAGKKKYRRSNGEGSIFRRSNGKWCGQIGLGYDINGIRKRKTVFGSTRAEVAKKLIELQGVINARNLIPNDNTTLGQFMNEWLKDFKRPTVSPRTYEWYLNIEKSISNKIKKRALHQVSTYEIQNMLNTMQNDGLSVRSVKAAYNLLNQVYKAAIDFHMLSDNPLTKVKIKRYETTKKQKALSVSDRKAVMTAVDQHVIYKPMIYTMMGMGLRIGELLALKWDDIDFNNITLRINKAAKATPEINDDGEIIGRSMKIGSTKTVCSVRTLPMPMVVTAVLKAWRKVYITKFIAAETGNLVFPNKYGALRSYSGFKRQFARFLQEKGCPIVTFHQFRHTYATMMLERGVNPRVVQEYMGHRDISTTLGIYTGVTSAVMKEAADGADEAMRKMV